MKALVTGGGGFLGGRIVALLREGGHEVRFLARGRYPEVEALGAEGWQVDIRDRDALPDAMAGIDVVFHVAALAGYWGRYASYADINVAGTRHVLDAALAAGVARLVYTSTPSVVGYGHDAEGIAEAPYPARFESAYAQTKAEAEQLILAANGAGIATVALRPHLIIGPGEPNLLPRVIERARRGQLRIVGDGRNRVDLTYLDNAAWAHLDAAAALTGPDAPCAGKAYFVSNGEPVVLWEWINAFLGEVGVPQVTGRVPTWAAVAAGAALEWTHQALRRPGEPRLTRFVALALSRSHHYDLRPAERDLGYRIRVPLAEGTARTVAWFRGLR